MPATFWSNTIWFVLLGISTLIELYIALKKASNPLRIIALFFFISGMTFSIEVNLYCFLRAYDYHPMIIPHSPMDDGLVGNLFSQFSITATALLMIALNLKLYWAFIFGGIYGLIEIAFTHLEIYSQNWYQTWMTVVGFPILFFICIWVSKSNRFLTGKIFRFVTLYFGLYNSHMIFVWWPLLVSGIVRINLNLLMPQQMLSYTFVSFMNLIIVSIACTLIYFSRFRPWIKVIILLMLYGIFFLALRLNIFHVPEGWALVIATIDFGGMFLLIYLLDKLFTRAAGIKPAEHWFIKS